MKITIEETQVELPLPKKDVRLQQVIEEVEDFLLSVGRVPVGLAIDQKKLTQEELDAKLHDVLTGEEHLAFTVEGIFSYLIQHLDGARGANEELKKKILSWAKSIQLEEVSQQEGKELVIELNHFFDFWFKLGRLVPEDVGAIQFQDKEYGQLFEELGALFKEIVEAMTENDFVLAADLLQYEVVPSLEVIDQVIPALKKRLKEREAKDQESVKSN